MRSLQESLQLLESWPEALATVIAAIAMKIRLGSGPAVDYNQRNLPGTRITLHSTKWIIPGIEGFGKGR